MFGHIPKTGGVIQDHDTGNRIERVLELFLWNSRFMIVVPGIISISAALGVLFITTVDALGLFGRVFLTPIPV